MGYSSNQHNSLVGPSYSDAEPSLYIVQILNASVSYCTMIAFYLKSNIVLQLQVHVFHTVSSSRCSLTLFLAKSYYSGHKNLLLKTVFLLAVNSLYLWIIYFLGHSLDFNIPYCVLLRCQIEFQN